MVMWEIDPGSTSSNVKQGAEMINPYNPQLLLAWQANMDIQMVGFVCGAAMYVSHYTCKDESQALKKVIADNLARLPGDASVRFRLSKIGNTLLSHRQLSQQEAAFLMTGLHLKGSSRATVFVATVPEERRTRLVKPSSQLRELGDEDTNVLLMGLIDHYAACSEGECFNSMTLAHFTVWYNYTAAPVGDDDHSGNRLPRYELQNGLGTITQCRLSACLRVPVMSPESHGDDYYYQLLMLYLPWRNERVDLLGEYQTAREAFLAKRDHLQFLNADHSSFADEVQRAVQQLSTLQQNQFGDNLYVPLAPSTMQNRLENGGEGNGFDPLYDGDVNIDPSVNLHCNSGVDIMIPRSRMAFRHQCLMTKTPTFFLEGR